MRNLDEINAVSPLHSRTGCSDTHLINAGFNDHGNLWCPRCQSLRELNLFNQNTALKTQINDLLELIYNSAEGEICMGYKADIENMAQVAHSITGINASQLKS